MFPGAHDWNIEPRTPNWELEREHEPGTRNEEL
jgi:hypothetical protein